MRYVCNTIFSGIILFSLFIFWLFCGNPTKPVFKLPPSIENGKAIITSGIEVYGASYIMYIKADGTAPLTYRWYKNNSLINGSNNDTLSFNALVFADSGVYHCVVSNEFGADTSLTDTLRIAIGDSLAPIILNNKAIQTSGTEEKDSTFFMYIKAIGSDTLSYQWYKNGSPFANEIKDTLPFDTLNYSDTGFYFCIVSNNFGADTSVNDTITLDSEENHAPVWTVDTLHITVYEGVACSLTLSDSCTDPDGDSITFTLDAGDPVGDTILSNIFVFIPGYDDSGIYYITINASDSNKISASLLQMIVINTNRAPVFLDSLPDDYYYVPEDSQLVISFKAIDYDGDSVLYILAKNELPDNGPIIFNDSQFIWNSTYTDSGYYVVEIHATDGIDTTKASPIIVAVGDVNQFPDAVNDSANTLEDSACIIDVLSNDNDPDGDSIYVSSVSNGNIGTCMISNNRVHYTPSSDYFGIDTVFYSINDTTRGTDTGMIIIVVTPVNDPPSFTLGSNIAVHQDTGNVTVIGWATNISAGPPNESAQTLQFFITLNDTAGLFTQTLMLHSTTGDLYFTTAGNTSGSLEISVILKDNGGTANSGCDSSQVETFTITVTEVNHPPKFDVPTTSTTNVVLDEGNSQNITFIISDQDGTIPFLELVSPPLWVSVTDNGNNNYTLTISPYYNLASNTSPQYLTDLIVKVVDEVDNSLFNTHTVNITVNNVNRSPVFNEPKPDDTTLAIGTYYEVALSAQDPDGDNVTIMLTQGPDGMSYDKVVEKVVWDIDRLKFRATDGPYEIIVKVMDGYDTTTYSWKDSLKTHSWELITSRSLNNFIAKDSNIVFDLEGGGPEENRDVYISKDGGKNWIEDYYRYSWNYLAGYGVNLNENKLYIKGIGAVWYSTVMIEVLDISQEPPVLLESITGGGVHGWKAFDICKANGAIYILGWGGINSNNDTTYIYDTDYIDSVYVAGIIGDVCDITACKGNFVVFAVTENAILRKNRSISTQWFKVNETVVNDPSITKIEIPSTFGDSLYLIDKDNKLQRSINGNASSVTFSPIVLNVTPKKIKMVTARAGWIVDSNGQVYFTNDGFNTITKEIFQDESGAEIGIGELYIADDEIGIFAYGNGKLFRY